MWQLEHFSGTMRLGILLDGLEPKKHMLPLSLFCIKPWIGRRLLYVSVMRRFVQLSVAPSLHAPTSGFRGIGKQEVRVRGSVAASYLCRVGVLQYVPVMVLCVLLTLVTKSIP